MTSDPDLSHSITLHPHPFHLQSSRSGTPQRATSSSFEPVTPEPDAHGPVARHASVGPALFKDLEGQRPLRLEDETDPYRLAAHLKSPSEIDLIRPNSSRKRDCYTPSVVKSDARRAKKLQGFYQSQNENIERLLKPVDEHRRLAKELYIGNEMRYKIAVHGSFAANLILAGLQVYGAASSGSLSLFTTMADAIFDPLSNVMLILSHRAVNHVDPRRFPSGKARIETAGNIVFCFTMCSVSFILIVMSARDLAQGSNQPTRAFHLPSVIAVGIAFVTKLSLFIYCWTLRNTYSQVRILWEDHRNDIIINGFGVLTSVGGSKLRWWIDPSGAIILSCLISILWLRTAYCEFQLLIGVTADTQLQQLITYIGTCHKSSTACVEISPLNSEQP